MALPPFYNLRGPAYPWEPLKLAFDQRGSPDPEWSFPQFRTLGWNLVRMDGLSWGKYVLDKAGYLANLARVYNAANAAGVWIIWTPEPQPDQMPADIQAAIPRASWWSSWWNNVMYPGTNPVYQNFPIWSAWFGDFVLPLIQAVDAQPCTLGYKFVNEPLGMASLGQLANFYTFMGFASRNISSKRLVYEGPGAHPGLAGLIDQLQIQNYRPAIYDVHYPSQTDLANDGAAAASKNVDFWDGEDRFSDLNSVAFQTALKNANCATNIFRWDKDGNLLVADGTGSGGTGTLTATATNLSNLETQVLGPAVFNSGGPPPTATSLTIHAKVL